MIEKDDNEKFNQGLTDRMLDSLAENIAEDIQKTVEGSVDQRLEDNHNRVKSGELAWCMQNVGPPSEKKLAVLMAEAGEVAASIQSRYAGTSRGDLRAELIDLAAAAIGWLYALEFEKRGFYNEPTGPEKDNG